MSVFDSMFSNLAAPHLMNYMGTRQSVRVEVAAVDIKTDVDAIIRHQTTEDAFTSDDAEVKEHFLEIDLLIDEASTYQGLAANLTNAVIIIDTVRWSIDQIIDYTRTFQRLRLKRVEPRGQRREGFYTS